MTDSELILNYLQRYPGWQNAADMMRALKPGCVGWAMRSRISDMNRGIGKIKLLDMGLFIESRRGENGMEDYRMVNTQPSADLAQGNQILGQSAGSKPSEICVLAPDSGNGTKKGEKQGFQGELGI